MFTSGEREENKKRGRASSKLYILKKKGKVNKYNKYLIILKTDVLKLVSLISPPQ